MEKEQQRFYNAKHHTRYKKFRAERPPEIVFLQDVILSELDKLSKKLKGDLKNRARSIHDKVIDYLIKNVDMPEESDREPTHKYVKGGPLP